MTNEQSFSSYLRNLHWRFEFVIGSLNLGLFDEDAFDDDSIESAIKYLDSNRKNIVRFNKSITNIDIDDLIDALNLMITRYPEDKRLSVDDSDDDEWFVR